MPAIITDTFDYDNIVRVLDLDEVFVLPICEADERVAHQSERGWVNKTRLSLYLRGRTVAD